jgi:hypothetical protein
VDAWLIDIGNPMQLSAARAGNSITLSWPNTIVDTLLEGSGVPGPSAHWLWLTNSASTSPSLLNVTLPVSGNEFFRVRRPW